MLSTTETLQRSLGMVNNRVFEALSCGAAVVVRIVFGHCAVPAQQRLLGWPVCACHTSVNSRTSLKIFRSFQQRKNYRPRNISGGALLDVLAQVECYRLPSISNSAKRTALEISLLALFLMFCLVQVSVNCWPSTLRWLNPRCHLSPSVMHPPFPSPPRKQTLVS